MLVLFVKVTSLFPWYATPLSPKEYAHHHLRLPSLLSSSKGLFLPHCHRWSIGLVLPIPSLLSSSIGLFLPSPSLLSPSVGVYLPSSLSSTFLSKVSAGWKFCMALIVNQYCAMVRTSSISSDEFQVQTFWQVFVNKISKTKTKKCSKVDPKMR